MSVGKGNGWQFPDSRGPQGCLDLRCVQSRDPGNTEQSCSAARNRAHWVSLTCYRVLRRGMPGCPALPPASWSDTRNLAR